MLNDSAAAYVSIAAVRTNCHELRGGRIAESIGQHLQVEQDCDARKHGGQLSVGPAVNVRHVVQ